MDEALIRFQRDIAVVGDAAGTYYDKTMQMTMRALLHSVMRRARLAFQNTGDPLNPAWVDLVSIVAEYLAYRGKFPPGDDDPERSRLQMFVVDNTDILRQAALPVRT